MIALLKYELSNLFILIIECANLADSPYKRVPLSFTHVPECEEG
jgi:hypothetical protein